MSQLQRIAFIGLGNMGAPMAMNLCKAGYTLQVFDLSAAALNKLSEAGASIAHSAQNAVKDAQIIISMLPASTHVENLYLSADTGILSHIAQDALIIDCSTIAPWSAQKVAQAAQARGLAMLDAPVSGGTAGAAAGTLSFMVGGSTESLERAHPLLSAMGKNIFHAGDHGAGQTAKICNNMLLGILMAGTAEALALGVANGLDPKILSDIMSKSSGRNWALELYNPYPGVMDNVPASRNYSGGFGVNLMLKDLGLATQAALAGQATIPLGELTRNLYSMHSQHGAGEKDFSSILECFTVKQ
ncbi:3-hydroxyisobutyrate dehydrogenase [Undibacterium flavidum]|uniref:3-hydroxyisobutyrate dehydrogenase n=1 Tax=Undibacterium flavidum TaxID=2762297 RepID=A0ABR6YH47_9BURK|nr:3-hydroxyisobutyrate dehydrogenase [Undibacterium flavidum]MBC3875916.1 3-hydroxyisobutyrate dehydrogenase [Undibacterium flavidum]